jgi:hypothetical protein
MRFSDKGLLPVAGCYDVQRPVNIHPLAQDAQAVSSAVLLPAVPTNVIHPGTTTTSHSAFLDGKIQPPYNPHNAVRDLEQVVGLTGLQTHAHRV